MLRSLVGSEMCIRDRRGGPVVPGFDYIVGETGPERLRIGAPGNVSPLGGGNVINIAINVPRDEPGSHQRALLIDWLSSELRPASAVIPCHTARSTTGTVSRMARRIPGSSRGTLMAMLMTLHHQAAIHCLELQCVTAQDQFRQQYSQSLELLDRHAV